jgi:hypothetical protein
MARLDAMQGAIFANAANGDIPSIDACLRIIHQRARLLGLYPNDKHNTLHPQVKVMQQNQGFLRFLPLWGARWGEPGEHQFPNTQIFAGAPMTGTVAARQSLC